MNSGLLDGDDDDLLVEVTRVSHMPVISFFFFPFFVEHCPVAGETRSVPEELRGADGHYAKGTFPD
jgi:hypothetical protein